MEINDFVYSQVQGSHVWKIPGYRMEFFKKTVFPLILFNKNNQLKGFSDGRKIRTSDDYWFVVGQIAKLLINNSLIQLDFVIVDCKSTLTVDFEESILKIGPYNDQGYENEMLKFVNDCFNYM